jgi:hypothetical protein
MTEKKTKANKKKDISRAWAMGEATHTFDGKKWKKTPNKGKSCQK